MRAPLALLALAAASTPAIACNPRGAIDVSEVAAKGVVIRGRIVQAFDAEKEQPEIIHADDVFIGDETPRDFVIHRNPSHYEAHLAQNKRLKTRPKWVHSMCEPKNAAYPVGHVFDWLVLLPAGNYDVLNGRWKFPDPDVVIPSEHLLNRIVEEASKTGRFRSSPPKLTP